MGTACESWVRAHLLLRCLKTDWEVVYGGFGHDLALVNSRTGERRTIEVKARQALAGLTKHPPGHQFIVRLKGDQAEADFLIFCWFEHSFIFVVPTSVMRKGVTKAAPTLEFGFRIGSDNLPTGTSAHFWNGWDRLFEQGGMEHR
jgi:hypothetical protein